MEADWAAEVGSGLERIDADWAGFVDLRRHPYALAAIAETAKSAGLRDALTVLNAPDSPVFTCKCDVWPLASEEIDPREFDFPPEAPCVGLASYIDVVARDVGVFGSFENHEVWSRHAVSRLRGLPVAEGRADLVIRAAAVGGEDGFGITLYAAGCGLDSLAARTAWERILREAVAITMSEAGPPAVHL